MEENIIVIAAGTKEGRKERRREGKERKERRNKGMKEGRRNQPSSKINIHHSVSLFYFTFQDIAGKKLSAAAEVLASNQACVQAQ